MKGRIRSIDILRALTMLLMIFVNDLWTLEGIPGWLEHKPAGADGMGLADVIFPAFLFIVGLSIPHAIGARLGKGDSKTVVAGHIIERSLALLIMGVFMVNLEYMDGTGVPISRFWWQILMTLAFFIIWNQYKTRVFGRIPPVVMKITGTAILVFLAAIYSGQGEGTESEWMRFHWWGILGLIGWGYLVCALAYLFSGNRPGWIALLCVLFYLMNVNEFIRFAGIRINLVVSASNYASVMTGVLAGSILLHVRKKDGIKSLVPLLTATALVLFAFGFLTRPEWGISKIRATPSWTAVCAGISMIAFIILHLGADRLGWSRWARIIAPAGYSTGLC